MFDPSAHLATIYATLGESVTPAAGAAFNALLRYGDDTVFDLAAVSRVTLRWTAADAALAEGDLLTIRGVSWKLAEPPVPLGDGYEMTAPIQRAA